MHPAPARSRGTAVQRPRGIRGRTDLGALIHPFVQICLLRMRPQDLPSSATLLVLVLLTHTVTGVAAASVDLRFGRALAAGVAGTVLLCGLTTALLMLRTLRERTVQTLTALAGTGSVIGFMAYPLSLWIHDAPDRQLPVLALVLFAVLGWSLAVSAHILRHALSAPFYLGLLVSIAFYWISVKVLSSLFPLGG